MHWRTKLTNRIIGVIVLILLIVIIWMPLVAGLLDPKSNVGDEYASWVEVLQEAIDSAIHGSHKAR